MPRSLLILAALTILIGTGIVHGLQSNRWAKPPDFRAEVARLDRLAATIGDWEGQNVQIDPRELTGAHAEGYLSRRYTNRRDGTMISVLLLCGSPGPISVHTPDICYPGAGFEQVDQNVPCSFPLGPTTHPAEFWVSNFRKQGPALSQQLRIFWSWSGTGSWKASSAPRLEFSALPILYKLYVIREEPRLDAPVHDDPSIRFLQRFLPQLNATLFPKSEVRP